MGGCPYAPTPPSPLLQEYQATARALAKMARNPPRIPSPKPSQEGQDADEDVRTARDAVAVLDFMDEQVHHRVGRTCFRCRLMAVLEVVPGVVPGVVPEVVPEPLCSQLLMAASCRSLATFPANSPSRNPIIASPIATPVPR